MAGRVPSGQWFPDPTGLQASAQSVVLVTGPEVAIYEAVLLVAGLLCLGVAGYAWRYRDRRIAKPMLVLLLAVVEWIVMAWIAVQFAGHPIAKAASRAWFLGVTVAVACVFLIALEYTGREQYVTRTTVGLLLVPIALTNVAVWVPPLRDAFLTYGGVDPTTFIGYTVESGPLFYLHTAYSYLLLVAATVMFVSFALRSESVYRRQIRAILVAVIAPWIGNALYLFGPVDVDLTPVAFAVVGLALWWAIFREDLLEVVPVARSAVVDNISAAVFVLDRQNRLVDINPTGRRLLDLEDESIIGEDATALLDGMPAVRDRFEEVADADEEIAAEVSFGSNHYKVNISPLEDRKGRVIGRLFLVNDVTEEKRRQRELERQNEQLEEFANVVSHDLRNPLNVAAGNLELGRARSEGGEEFLSESERAIERMDDIIDDVLTLAREGRGVEDMEPVSLAAIAERAWRNVDASDATLTVTADRELEADPDRLQRALENLFRNSVDHGRADVTVTVGATADGFFVADDGPGIPAEHREEIFENGYTTADEGTGFGLAIVDNIVEAHGWTVTVGESETGGARFDVSGGSLVGRERQGETNDELVTTGG